MTVSFSIDAKTGDICIGNFIRLAPCQPKAGVASQVAEFLAGSRDHGSGYEWLDLRDLTFGSQPASLSLCFHDGSLKQAAWSVQLPDAPTEGGWPTRDAINTELAFVRSTLWNEMAIQPGRTAWGEVWSSFDAKGFMASNGVRWQR